MHLKCHPFEAIITIPSMQLSLAMTSLYFSQTAGGSESMTYQPQAMHEGRGPHRWSSCHDGNLQMAHT